MTRVLVLVLSLVAGAGMVFRGTAWLKHEEGEASNDVSLVRQAARLDLFVSDYPFEDYLQTDDLTALERAIRLEPTKPIYHMYYGLRVYDRDPKDPNAVREICLASELKPYSKEYRETCKEFKVEGNY